MTKDVKTLNIHQRLHAAMRDVSYVQKGDKKVNNQYRFVSHDAVTAAVRGPLLDAGVVYYPQDLKVTQNGNRTEVFLDVAFVNIDEPENNIKIPSFGYGIDQQDKGPGKAVSYAVKYALLKALGLETGDDPERDLIDHEPIKEDLFIPVSEAEFIDLYNRVVNASTQADFDSAKRLASAAKDRLQRTDKEQKTDYTAKLSDVVKDWVPLEDLTSGPKQEAS